MGSIRCWNYMNTHDVITARSRAIHFFGQTEYWDMVRSAKDYLDRQQITIPPEGVEHMPIFWECINTFMQPVAEK